MIAENIPLRFARGEVARLRELTGRDEYSVSGADTSSAIDLLTNLLRLSSENLKATDLVASDRDRLLAAVYKRAFGDQIESTLNCVRCGQPFDIDFSLDRLVQSLSENKHAGEWRELPDGRFETAKGMRFRLPTGSDELAAMGMAPAEAESMFLSRCVETSTQQEERAALEDLLEQVAPLIDLELVARCAECGHVHTVQFDIQTYLLGAIISERRHLLADINCLAATYSWSLDEILSLTRSDRRHLVELIENEYAA
jgi:hypothetical protein